jgi:hypothetical protein
MSITQRQYEEKTPHSAVTAPELSFDKLNGAPKYADENSWNWSDPNRPKAVDDYFSL